MMKHVTPTVFNLIWEVFCSLKPNLFIITFQACKLIVTSLSKLKRTKESTSYDFWENMVVQDTQSQVWMMLSCRQLCYSILFCCMLTVV